MAGKILLPFPNTHGGSSGNVQEIATLFHRLNNQLGIILANAELLETKLDDQQTRARAGQIVSSAVDAISTAQDIRSYTKTFPEK